MSCNNINSVSPGRSFSDVLISWYQLHKRDLPWRRTTDAYTVWISEIILQQTRVAQGYEYFLRFTERFPDIHSLANAPEDEVMKYWQGLGYYSRARNLHAAAKSLNGVFPQTYPEVLALKGVGEYTAAAICSIAYNMPYAVVDGNVYRVLARYFGIETPIDSTAGKKEFKILAQDLIDTARPALYNQAIMDFGALQCVPQSSNCSVCPLSESCMALATDKIKQLPVKQHKTKTRNRYFNYIFIHAGEYTYINKRTGKDIWLNLYEFPLIETSEPVTETQLYIHPEFINIFGPNNVLNVSRVQHGIKHVLSHRIIYASFYEITVLPGRVSLPGCEKILLSELDKYPIPRLIQSFLESI